jgi:two-component system phosphate regulon response regulator PhoB
MSKILVIEDEQDLRLLLELHLKRLGFQVIAEADGEKALQTVFQHPDIDLVMVDWMLPSQSGIDICQWIRKHSELRIQQLPILMMTARSEAEDIVAGLNAGADDYITKPFDYTVLVARVKSLLRRGELLKQRASESSLVSKQTQEVSSEPIEYRLGGLSLNRETYEVKIKHEVLALTPSEYKLLLALLQNQGRVLSRDRLIELVQGEGVMVVDRAVDTHIFGLRKKMGEYSEWVETIRGVGYRIRPESPSDSANSITNDSGGVS